MDRREAQKEKEKLSAVDPTWFCPLTSRICNKQCVCFVSPAVRNTSGESSGHYLQNAYCGNGMFQDRPVL